jgi:hypothetical protein
VGSTVTTTRSVAVDVNIDGAAISDVPVTSGKAYRASWWVRLSGDATAYEGNVRAIFKVKNGSTQLGTDARIVVTLDVNPVDCYLEFDWEAAATATIDTLNLTFQNETGTGVLTVSVAEASFHGLVEDLGVASVLGF